MSDIYLSLTETPSVVTLSQPVIGSSVAATVTVANTVTVALDANSLSALENVTVTVGAAVSVSNFPATQTIAGTVTANVGPSIVGDRGGGSVPINAVAIGHEVVGDGFYNVSSDKPFPISGAISGTVTVGNTVTIAGAVAVSNQPSEIVIKGYDIADDEYEVLRTDPDGILYVTPNSPISVLLRDGWSNLITSTTSDTKRGIDSNIISSVTIGSLPAISGTVTANIGVSTSIYGTLVDFNDGEGFRIQPGSSVSVSNSVTIGSLPAISGTVTANNPSGALTTRFGSVTTANTAQLTSAVTNASRKFLLVQNIATSTVTIGIGFAPTTTQGIQLTAGAGLTFDAFCPTGGVWWLSSTTGSNFSILEG
jgi:hypothetical protein